MRVTVYPSDFGLARMKEEEEHGPRGAFASAGDADRCARCVCRCSQAGYVLRALPRSGDEETAALDAEKLRVYERERLRFYYAIVECDSAATAASLYKQCDGLVRVPTADASGLVLRNLLTALRFMHPPRPGVRALLYASGLAIRAG